MKISVRKIKRFLTHRRLGAGNKNVNRDWFIVVVTFSSLFVLTLLLTSFFSYRVYKENIFRSEVESSGVIFTVDPNAITGLSAYYEARAERVEELRSDGADVVDPSR